MKNATTQIPGSLWTLLIVVAIGGIPAILIIILANHLSNRAPRPSAIGDTTLNRDEGTSDRTREMPQTFLSIEEAARHPVVQREWNKAVAEYDPVTAQRDAEQQFERDKENPLTPDEVANMPTKFQEAYQFTLDNDKWREQHNVSSEEWRSAVLELSRGRPLSVEMTYEEVRRYILRSRGQE